ncbi:MAG: hypothetical protein CVT62_05345 [Actinobacteria bacterium HGW-Actinobacteria-2]|nr:MAG: hypothetical protein CVT62_05345 [Actinobacteria bacterium HGW-Actinobacteria-2]
MVSSDALWGGQLTSLVFDPVGHTCELRVTTCEGGVTREYVVAAAGVTSLEFRSSIPEPWAYSELTEFHEEPDPTSGQCLLQIILWSEDAGIDMRCASWEVTEPPSGVGMLREVLDRHRLLEFPAHPESDEFDSWLLSLLDTDAFYVGLASAVVAGGKLADRPSLGDLDAEWTYLRAFEPSSDRDRAIHDDARAYLTSLSQLLAALVPVER